MSSIAASSSHDDKVHVTKPTNVTKVVAVIGSDKTVPVSVPKKPKKQFANCYIGDAADLGHLSQLGFDPVTGEFDVSYLMYQEHKNYHAEGGSGGRKGEEAVTS